MSFSFSFFLILALLFLALYVDRFSSRSTIFFVLLFFLFSFISSLHLICFSDPQPLTSFSRLDWWTSMYELVHMRVLGPCCYGVPKCTRVPPYFGDGTFCG